MKEDMRFLFFDNFKINEYESNLVKIWIILYGVRPYYAYSCYCQER